MLFRCARHVILYLVLVKLRIYPDMNNFFFDWDVKYQLRIIGVNSCSVLVYLEKAH